MKCVLAVVALVMMSVVASAGETVVDRSSQLQIVKTDFGLADGPAWDGAGSLYVPDVKGQTLSRFYPRNNRWQVVLPEAGRISASFYNNGRLYVSDNGNARIGVLMGKTIDSLVEHGSEGQDAMRPNDLVVDHHGGVYYTLTKQGQVRYIKPEGKSQTVLDDITTPNGIILSPDESTLYVSAYKPKEIWAYDVGDTGAASHGRLFATMDDGPELGADGMCIDRAGNVYCAGASDVWIWSPTGKLIDKIATPTRPINCAFGTQDMRTLYITGFGGLYAQRMRISGRSPNPPSSKQWQPQNEGLPSTVIPDDIDAKLDVVFAEEDDRKLLMDVFAPKRNEDSRLPAVVIVHGGGWLNGDKTKFRALGIALAERGYVTAAIEYRLGGEAHFPAGIQDCNAAVRHLRANADEMGIDADRIGAVGGSAGGISSG